jgi:AbrB family looped-hinge helix DNA binding protein
MTTTITKLSAKGQVVIPKDLRNRLNLKEGDTLLVYSTDSMLVIRKVTKQETILSIIAEPIRKKIKRLGITRKDLNKAIEQARRSEKAKGSY